MSTQTSTLRATWGPILGGLDEEEISCVINIAIERLRNDFGQPYSLKLETNPSGTVQPPIPNMPLPRGAAVTSPAQVAAQHKGQRFTGKRWLRVVDKLDLTGKGGYAIVGDYTHASRIGKVPGGRYIVVAERQNGKQRVAVVMAATGAAPGTQCDVFDDGTFMLNDCVRIAFSDGQTTWTNPGRVGGYHSGHDQGTPPHFHGTPWATIVAVLIQLGIPTT